MPTGLAVGLATSVQPTYELAAFATAAHHPLGSRFARSEPDMDSEWVPVAPTLAGATQQVELPAKEGGRLKSQAV